MLDLLGTENGVINICNDSDTEKFQHVQSRFNTGFKTG